MPQRFPSKVDTWIGVLLFVAPVLSLVSGITAVLAGGGLFALAPVAFVGLLYVGLVWPIAYEVTDEALVIRFGLMRSRVPYAKIKAVRPTRTILSSPALSLDRLHVDCGNPLGPNISPADRDGFYAALLAKAPHLHRQGDALVSR